MKLRLAVGRKLRPRSELARSGKLESLSHPPYSGGGRVARDVPRGLAYICWLVELLAFCDNNVRTRERTKPSPALTLPKGKRRYPSRDPKSKHPPEVQSTRLKDLAVRGWFSMVLRVWPWCGS